MKEGVYSIFWLAGLVLFLVFSFRGIKNHDYLLPLANSSPNGSLDSMLSDPLHLPDASQNIGVVFEKLPKGAPVVVFWPKGVFGAEIAHRATSYLGWPRRVWSSPIISSEVDQVPSRLGDTSAAALFFFGLPVPQAYLQSEQIGPLARVVVLKRGTP